LTPLAVHKTLSETGALIRDASDKFRR
jgi:hypothetical protein